MAKFISGLREIAVALSVKLSLEKESLLSLIRGGLRSRQVREVRRFEFRMCVLEWINAELTCYKAMQSKVCFHGCHNQGAQGNHVGENSR